MHESRVCPDYNDECFNGPNHEFIVRGCLDDIPFLGKVQYEIPPLDLDNQKYRTCSTSLCNDERIFKEYCQTCSSNISCSETVCPFSLHPMGCYSKINSESVVEESGCTVSLAPNEMENCNETDLCIISVFDEITTNQMEEITELTESNQTNIETMYTVEINPMISNVDNPSDIEIITETETPVNSIEETLSCIQCIGDLNSECAKLISPRKFEIECEISGRHSCYTSTKGKQIKIVFL